jgi:hypothetical protein
MWLRVQLFIYLLLVALKRFATWCIICYNLRNQIPSTHVDAGVDSSSRHLDRDVNNIIEDLLHCNQFTKNYGPRRLMTDLRARNASENLILS